MPIPIDDTCIINNIDEKLLFSLEKDKIEDFIKEIQTSMCKTQMQSLICNKTKSQIKKHKHMKYRYIPHAIRDYHEYEKKVRELEHDKVNLGKDISMARRKNDNKALEKFNKELYYLRLDIEDAVYMRSCILNEIRKIPGYDKFANKKCKFFSQASGCYDGNTCAYRH
jgi:hypothetical protein